MIKKAMLAAAAIALTSSPAWALPGNGHKGHGNPHTPSSAPGNSGDHHGPKGAGHSHSGGQGNQGDQGNQGSDSSGKKGRSHRCVAHEAAYVAAGTLVSDTLTEGPDHTYSGEVTVEVLHGNGHARGDKGTKKTYVVSGAHLTLAIADVDKDNLVAVDDLVPGDRVHLIGKVSALPKHCQTGGFTPQLTIKHIVFHGSRHETSSTTTTTSTTSSSTTAATTSTSTTTSTSSTSTS